MQRNKVTRMTTIAVCAAMGMVLQFIAIPFPVFSFLKIDFSDLPVLISMFLFGPAAGIFTAFIRSFLHLLLTGMDPANIVGDIASFIATSVFTLPIYYFFRKGLNRKNKTLGVVSGTLLMTGIMSIANYLVITPLYLTFFGLTAQKMLGMNLASYVAVGVLPFNLIKGLIVSVVFLVFHAKLLPWLSQKQRVHSVVINHK